MQCPACRQPVAEGVAVPPTFFMVRAVEEFRQWLEPRIGNDHGRRYVVTDGVLYEDEFPDAFMLVTGQKSGG